MPSLPLFDLISLLLNKHLNPRSGKLPFYALALTGTYHFIIQEYMYILLIFPNENALLSPSVHQVQWWNVFASYEEF